MSVNTQRWYPSNKGLTFEQHEPLRIAFDHIYSLQDELSALHGKHQELHGKMQGMTKENEKLKEIINNRIAGRLVKPVDPKNADTIRYNSTTGQFEFGP